MIRKSLEKIEASDIQHLVDVDWPEGLQIEFKRDYGKALRREKVLHPVCAFANTAGGDLIIGIDAPKGTAKGVIAIPSEAVDQEKLRVEDWIRTGIEPYPVTVRIQGVNVQGGAVLVVRVDRSYMAPHRVVDGRLFKARNSGGNYDMTMDQIRRAYVEGATLIERIRDFRAERVQLISSRSLPVASLMKGPKLILHIVPLAAFSGDFEIDVHAAHGLLQSSGMTAFGYSIDIQQYNLDGVLGIAGIENPHLGFVQIFRTGIIEVVSELFGEEADPNSGTEAFVGPADEFMVPYFRPYVRVARDLGLLPPVYSTISVTGVTGRTLKVPRSSVGLRHRQDLVDRDVLLLPDTELPLDEEGAIRSLKPTFDVFWQAFGFPGSPNFDNAGNWTKGLRN